jgi:serine/threonine-protein kinase
LKLWRFLLILAGAVALFGVGLLFFNFLIMPRLIHRNTVVLVPDMRGKTLSEATEVAARLDLQISAERQRAHPTIKIGEVLDQEPAPATPIRRGRLVEVVTSSGPPANQVPDLRGLSRRQAEITLQRESFRLGRLLRLRKQEVTVPTVLYQYPPAGVVLRKGRAVSLVVAEPALPPIFRMPTLIGLSLFAARDQIAAAGCVTAPVVYERRRRVPVNTILGQNPPPGERVRKGARIELVATSR